VLFETPHKPGTLAQVITVIGDAGLNLIHLHNVHVGNKEYHFAAEVSVPQAQLSVFAAAAKQLPQVTTKLLIFGPFEEHCV
jgi:prephenate dehydratase